jgi:hypothetical protein
MSKVFPHRHEKRRMGAPPAAIWTPPVENEAERRARLAEQEARRRLADDRGARMLARYQKRQKDTADLDRIEALAERSFPWAAARLELGALESVLGFHSDRRPLTPRGLLWGFHLLFGEMAGALYAVFTRGEVPAATALAAVAVLPITIDPDRISRVIEFLMVAFKVEGADTSALGVSAASAAEATARSREALIDAVFRGEAPGVIRPVSEGWLSLETSAVQP